MFEDFEHYNCIMFKHFEHYNCIMFGKILSLTRNTIKERLKTISDLNLFLLFLIFWNLRHPGGTVVDTYSDNKFYDKDQRKDIFYYCFYTNPRNCWQISRTVDWQIIAQQGWHRPKPQQPTSKLIIRIQRRSISVKATLDSFE